VGIEHQAVRALHYIEFSFRLANNEHGFVSWVWLEVAHFVFVAVFGGEWFHCWHDFVFGWLHSPWSLARFSFN